MVLRFGSCEKFKIASKNFLTFIIREAAILQTFPNDFEFIGSQAACFKMSGETI
uniref:DNA cytosine methyltransferase n=1 Tax=Helicobacter pylori TaxID=210 RepID=UPI0035946A7E